MLQVSPLRASQENAFSAYDFTFIHWSDPKIVSSCKRSFFLKEGLENEEPKDIIFRFIVKIRFYMNGIINDEGWRNDMMNFFLKNKEDIQKKIFQKMRPSVKNILSSFQEIIPKDESLNNVRLHDIDVSLTCSTKNKEDELSIEAIINSDETQKERHTSFLGYFKDDIQIPGSFDSSFDFFGRLSFPTLSLSSKEISTLQKRVQIEIFKAFSTSLSQEFMKRLGE